MIAGLPGTGIGGLFYLLLVAFMPLRHGWRAMRRRARAEHARVVLRSVAFAGAIYGVLWVQAWALEALVVALAPAGVAGAAADALGANAGAYMRAAAFAGFGTLTFVVALVHVLRLLVRRPPVAAPPAALPSTQGVEAEGEGTLARLRRAG